MSPELAIRVEGLSKYYHIYDRPEDRLKHAIVPRFERLIGRKLTTYGRDFWALSDVSFDVRRGETVGIIGRNGSGKSTLLQIICGTLQPARGSVEVHGRVAALLELGSGFNPEFTGRDNVYMNGAVLGLSTAEIDARYDAIAGFADIGAFIDQPVKTYSSGMVVRLAFAVSVSVEPDVLVIDEALAVGDMAFQQKCLDRLAGLRAAGTTILLVTHDIMLTRNYCDRVVYLDGGRVQAIGDAERIGEQYLRDIWQSRHGTSGGAVAWDDASAKARFGTGRGAIIACRITAAMHAGPIFHAGEQAAIAVTARAGADVASPEIIVQIRDVRGYVLYGLATEPSQLAVRLDGSDRMLSAVLDVKLMLGPGEYGITVGFVDRQGESVVTVIDKVVSAVTFTIAPVPASRAHGPVDLGAEWRPRHDA